MTDRRTWRRVPRADGGLGCIRIRPWPCPGCWICSA